MKKLIIASTLLLSLCSTINANTYQSTHDIELKDSLLWKVTGKEITQPSYLYGTMHMVCDSKMVDKAKVAQAIKQTSQLYLELDMDNPQELFKVMSLAGKGAKVKDIEDENTRTKLLELAEQHLGVKAKLLKDSSMFNLMSMIAMKALPACESGSIASSVEQYLMTIFAEKKQEVKGLETAQEQMSFVAESGMMDADVMLKSFEEFDEVKELYKKMITFYETEGVDDLFSLISTPSELYSAEDTEKMLQGLLAVRNQNWIKLIPEIAKQQTTFFGFGAGHLGGDIGVINLLREQGYTVEAVMD